MAYLTVEQARQLTADADGRRLNRKDFRKLVNAGVIPSWKNPLTGKLRIDEDAFRQWMRDSATHDPKRAAS